METPDASNTQASPQAAAAAPGAAPNTDAAAAAPAAAGAASSKPATTKTASKADKKKTAAAAAGSEPDLADKPNPNPQTVEIWPLRSYQDAGEIKRRSGPSYTAAKRHADALIARGLATDEEPPKAKNDKSK